MKRVGNLWPQIVSFANLAAAAKAAAAGKRGRPDVAAFNLNLEWEILALRRELESGAYVPGPYRKFRIRDPKPREISAAPFRDRVVHHALTRVIEPIFENRFSPHSYACRKGLGTHAALRRAAKGARGCSFALKCDIRKYFASIDHTILLDQLSRTIKCRPTLDLAARIVSGFRPAADPPARYFPGDNLFTPFERLRGLPLGNQTSQFFANLYLNGLDHLVGEKLRPEVYVRYVDDFVLFGQDKSRLREMQSPIGQTLESLRLELHPGKSRIYRTADGVTFLGWRIFPDRLRLVRPNIAGFRRRMRALQRDYAAGSISWDDVSVRVQSWLGHVSHGDTWVLRERLLSEFAFGPGGWPERPGRLLRLQCEEPPGGRP